MIGATEQNRRGAGTAPDPRDEPSDDGVAIRSAGQRIAAGAPRALNRPTDRSSVPAHGDGVPQNRPPGLMTPTA
jgi:hypothetical protein